MKNKLFFFLGLAGSCLGLYRCVPELEVASVTTLLVGLSLLALSRLPPQRL